MCGCMCIYIYIHTPILYIYIYTSTIYIYIPYIYILYTYILYIHTIYIYIIFRDRQFQMRWVFFSNRLEEFKKFDNIQCWQRCGKINSVMLLLQWPFHWGKLSYNCWIQKCLLYVCVSAQLYIAIWDPMDWGLPSSSVHGVLQARILEWVAITYSRGSSRPRDQIHVSCISCTGRWIIYHWATWEAHISSTNHMFLQRDT